MRFDHLGLLCSVDRVGPLDTETQAGFGLNLSASFVPAPEGQCTFKKEHANLFQSWTWTVASVEAWGREKIDETQFGPWEQLAGAEIVPLPAQAGELIEGELTDQPLNQAVERRLQRLSHDPAAFFWDPLTEGDEEGEKVRYLLATLSTQPAPVPHALRLSWLVRTPKAETEAFDEIAIVPVFGAGGLGARGPQKQKPPHETEPVPPEERERGIFTVPYDPVADKPGLVAYLLPAPARVEQPAHAFLDLATGWVRKAPEGVGTPEWSAGDWTVRLERTAANAFDLAQRLIDAAREHVGGEAFRNALAPRLAELRGAVLAAVRDVAGVGVQPAPDGLDLIEEVRRASQREDIPWDRVRDTLARWEKEQTPLDAWAGLLAGTVPEVASLAIVKDRNAPLPVEQLEEELSAWETLQSTLSDEPMLRRLVLAQWRKALEGTGLEAAAGLLEEKLPELSLRQRLAHGNLGRFWRELVRLDRNPETGQSIDPGKELEARLGEQLEVLRKLRFDPSNAPLLVAKIQASLAGFAKRFAEEVVPPSDPGMEGEGSPTPVPHGVTLQLDRVAALSDDPADSRGDLLRALSGFGVLLRPEDGTWRCLNMARLMALGDTSGEVHPTAVIPYRLGYRNGLRETAVTYDNHPLAATSPAAALADGLALQPEAAESAGDPWAAMLRHDFVNLPPQPGTAFAEWARLPALKFGGRYEALPFAVANAGVLPQALAQAGDPTALAEFNGFDGGRLPGAHIRKFRYLRRVRVGPPRYGQGIGEKIENELIPIPASVAPLAREIPASGEDVPLLLLAPPDWRSDRRRNDFEFRLRKPSVDLNTWDRWTAADAGTRDLRIKVWAGYHREVPKDLARTITKDLTIDDPAVADRFHAVLRPVHGVAAGVQELTVPDVPIPANSGVGALLPEVQRGAVAVHCAIGAEGSGPDLQFIGGKLEVSIPPGQVWELRIHPVIPVRFFDEGAGKRFHGGLTQELERQGDVFLAPPFRLLVESARAWTSGQVTALQRAIWSALEPKTLGARIAVRLDTAAPGPAFQLASRVELRRQVWRWNGRPLSRFPFESQRLDDDPAVLAWEAEAFAEREDEDCARTVTAVSLLDKKPLLYEEDRSGDARALLYRFGLVAFSRYEELGAPRARVAASSASPVPTPWRRLLHRCRWTEEVPKPRVKLVVPLTEAEEEEPRGLNLPLCALPPKGHGVSGLLVVLNEPWYEIGGLAEGLGAELATADLEDGQGIETLPEIGPDPILTGKPWDGEREIRFVPEGPIGHTFDTGSSSPLFVSSSFILPPPKLAERDLFWHFAKVRFVRNLDGGGIEGGAGAGRTSAPTDPFWVQFLPDASAYAVREVGSQIEMRHLGLSDLAIKRVQGGTFQLVTRRGDKPVFIEPHKAVDPTARDRFFQVVLLTRLIREARGRQEEKYLGLFRFDAGAWQPLDGSETIGEGGRLRARVVEMQEREPRPSTNRRSPWPDLFRERSEQGRPQDALLRIVRVSPPID